MSRTKRRKLTATAFLIMLVAANGFFSGQRQSAAQKNVHKDSFFESVSSDPPLEVKAVKSVRVKKQDHVIYAITLNDYDTFRAKNGKTILFQDQNCQVKALKIRSMKSFHLSYRGSTKKSQIWDIVGEPSNKPGTYIDEWEASNSSQKDKILRDKPVIFKVEVRIE